jgi:hypothetical protein
MVRTTTPEDIAKIKSKWVGLTDDEILEEYRQSYGDDGNLTDVYFARAIEAKRIEELTQLVTSQGIRLMDAEKEWVGLTDEERNDCLVEADPCEALAEPEARQLMEEVEAKLKEKNT